MIWATAFGSELTSNALTVTDLSPIHGGCAAVATSRAGVAVRVDESHRAWPRSLMTPTLILPGAELGDHSFGPCSCRPGSTARSERTELSTSHACVPLDVRIRLNASQTNTGRRVHSVFGPCSRHPAPPSREDSKQMVRLYRLSDVA